MTAVQTCSDHGHAALEYATRYDFHVFAQHDDPFTATTDTERILQRWRERPKAGVMLATGRLSGIVALIVEGDAAKAELAALEQKHGTLEPACYIIGARGRVYLFQLPAGLEVPTLDHLPGSALGISGKNGGVLLPPADLGSGEFRSWTSIPNHGPIPAPRWLLDRLRTVANGGGIAAATEGATEAVKQPQASNTVAHRKAVAAGHGSASAGRRPLPSSAGKPASSGKPRPRPTQPKDGIAVTKQAERRSTATSAKGQKARRRLPQGVNGSGGLAKGGGTRGDRELIRAGRRLRGMTDPFMLM